METEKNILTETICKGMGSQEGTENGKANLDAFLGRELDLERWVGESDKDYRERLFSIHATQIGLIYRYESEKKLEKLRATDSIFKALLEQGHEEDVSDAKNVISTLQKDVALYVKQNPELYNKPKIKEKIKDLESLT